MEDDATCLAVPRRPLPRRRLRQSKITEYFNSTAGVATPKADEETTLVQRDAPRISFFDLPQHLRCRIYDEAGVGRDKFVDLNFWNIEEYSWIDHEGRPLNEVPYAVEDSLWETGKYESSEYFEGSFPFGLITCGSRRLQDEVQAHLYAHNTFAVSARGPGGLAPLENLGDAALRELRVLVVSLRPCKCITPFCSKTCWYPNNPRYDSVECIVWPRPRDRYFWETIEQLVGDKPGHSRPLGRISRIDKTTLARWQRICTRLASNTRPRQLQLYLTAEPQDTEVAHEILKPLWCLPELKDIAVNLGSCLAITEARSLGRSLINSLTNNFPPTKPFRFLDLPTELQIKILRHSSLADAKTLDWDPRGSFRPWRSCDEEEQHPSRSHSAFCSASYGSASSVGCCECSDSHLAFFLVSKAFAEVARIVFYGDKQFWLLPSTSSWNPGSILGENDGDRYCNPLPSFLRTIPQRDIAYLAHMVVVLPPMTPHGFDSLLDEWTTSIKKLQHAADLPRLKLEVHFSDEQLPMYWNWEPGTFIHRSFLARKTRDPELEKAMLDTYKRIVAPLKMLGESGLRAFLVYVPWPLCATGKQERKANEMVLERLVMGAEYDSARWGKLEESSYAQPEMVDGWGGD